MNPRHTRALDRLEGQRIETILAGATMTTMGQDLGSRWNAGGLRYTALDGSGQPIPGQYTRFTLTGQGTADRMYPINHGTILSPAAGGRRGSWPTICA